MTSTNKASGVINTPALIIILVLGVVCLSGWLVFSQQDKQKSVASTCNDHATITQTGRSSENRICVEPATNFETCQQQPGSKTQESFPEVCVDAYGNSFINTAQEKNVSAPQ